MGDQHDDIVRLAVMAAGPVDGNERAWMGRVYELAPKIAAMFRPPMSGHENDATTPGVVARKVLDSSVFRAEFVACEMEESSKRLIVSFRSETTNKKDADADGTESLRTEPMWTVSGRHMRKIVEAMVPGQKANVFKHIDTIDGSRKSRVLAHIEPLGKPNSSRPAQAQSTPPTVDSAPAARTDETGEGAASRPASVSSDSPSLEVLWKQIEDVQAEMGPMAKVRAARALREQGVENFITPETQERAIAALHVMRDFQKRQGEDQ